MKKLGFTFDEENEREVVTPDQSGWCIAWIVSRVELANRPPSP